MEYKTAKKDLYQFVNDLRMEFDIKYSSYPINMLQICATMPDISVDFHQFKTKGMCGIAMMGEKSDTIILNSTRSTSESNFDCGHEVIHLRHHRNCGEDCFKCFAQPKPQQNNFLEWQANEGSAELIVPYALLLPKIKSVYKEIRNWLDLKRLSVELALDFNVPLAVIKYRIENLKCEIAQYNSGTPLNDLIFLSNSQQKERGIAFKSLYEKFPAPSNDRKIASPLIPLSTVISQILD